VTFLFTDIEGSTKLLRAAGDEYASLLARHREIVRRAVEANNGHEIGTEGDSFFVTFERASDGLNAAVQAQLGLCEHPWEEGREIRVRMGLHTGEASVASNDYIGLAVHQAARISSAAHGQQILVSKTTTGLLGESRPPEVTFRDIGTHRLKDFDEPVALLQVVHPDLPGKFATPTSAGAYPTNLPALVTTFVGREREIETVKEHLAVSRLVTLTGAGGVGKTRLAIEAGRAVAHDYPDGVWLVDLAPIAEPGLVPQAVGQALGVTEPEAAATWMERIVEHLRESSALLIFDNCEHLVAGCADVVSQLSSRCASLRIMATTREPLGLDGEIAWRVPSLGTEDDAYAAAVALFLERAREVVPRSESDIGSVRAICAHLDGIPLAIELAAARMQALTVEQILERIDDRFRLLRGSGRRKIERQQTMRATVDWSYALLSEQERDVLGRLSVFAGGCTLDAAEYVCAAGEITADDVIELLESLVRKSLVQFDVAPDSGGRYKLLETIRQYASEKLIDSGDATRVRTSHRAYFLEVCEGFERATAAGNDVEATRRLDAEFDNIRAAVEWYEPEDDGQVPLRIIGSLLMYLMVRGHLQEIRDRGVTALSADAGKHPSLARLKVLAATSVAAYHTYDFALDERLTQEALELGELFKHDPDAAMAYTGALIGDACLALDRRNDQDEAMRVIEAAVAYARSMGDANALAWALFNYGSMVWSTDITSALAALEEARDIANERSWSGMIEPNLAFARFQSGDLEGGHALAEHAVAAARETRYPLPLMRALSALSMSARLRGDFALAQSCAEEQIVVGREAGERIQGVAMGNYNLAQALRGLGRRDEALERAEEALAISTSLGVQGYDGFAPLVEELRSD
jgi:predicted ATPase/class 3 adenylate cyclase